MNQLIKRFFITLFKIMMNKDLEQYQYNYSMPKNSKNSGLSKLA